MTCLAFIVSLLVAAPRFIHYNAADGLPSNTVYAVTQDAEGALWIGTRNGLARFDGVRYVYDHGIFLGTATWWFLLSSGISMFRKRFHLRQMLVINRISGTLIALLGLASLIEGLARLILHQSFIGL